MKKLLTIAALFAMALLIAAPASALDANFSGELRMQGFSHDNVDLEEDGSTDSYYRSRFRLKTVLEITENLSVTGQFDALDKYWGKDPWDTGARFSSSTLSYEDPDEEENIEWDVAYATIKTKVGGILVGRQWNSQWGCFGIGDSTGPVDRILYLLPIENFTFVAYAQKYDEYDEEFEDSISDADNDKYVALVKYQGKDIEAGLLGAFYNFKSFPAMRDLIPYRGAIRNLRDAAAAKTSGQVRYDATRAAYLAALNQNPAFLGALGAVSPGKTSVNRNDLDQAEFDPYTGGVPTSVGKLINASLLQVGQADMPTVYNSYNTTQTAYTNAAVTAGAGVDYADSARAYILDPYFVAKFGGFTLKGEFIYGWGEAEFDGNAKDLDVDIMQYIFEAGYETGPVSFRGGYWFMSGDNDTTDGEHNSVAYIEPNRDLDIAFLLTGDNDHYTSDVTNFLGGGIGNFSGNSQNLAANSDYAGALALAGAKMFYLGIDYKPIDTLTLGVTWACAKADQPPGPDIYNIAEEWDDEVGNEYDFKVVWKPWENLEYKFIAAYLEAGDFWKQGAADLEVDDLFTLYNALTISF